MTTTSSTGPANSAQPPPLPRTRFRLPDISGAVSRPLMIAAAAMFVAAFFLPPHGMESGPKCLFKEVTEVPCLGCGMTRGVTCAAQGRIGDAVQYNAFALLLWPFIVVLAMGGFIPPLGRRMLQFVRDHRPAVSRVFWTVGILYAAFGIARLFIPALRGAA